MESGNKAPSSDEVQISSLMSRYARFVDARDIERVMACFTADAHLSFNGGAAVADGEEAMRAFWGKLFGGPVLGEASTHIMANYVIDIDGDRATAASQGVAYIYTDGTVFARGITYDDLLVRTPEGWRLSSREHNAQWQFEAPAKALP